MFSANSKSIAATKLGCHCILYHSFVSPFSIHFIITYSLYFTLPDPDSAVIIQLCQLFLSAS